jgi:hypothetical protein
VNALPLNTAATCSSSRSSSKLENFFSQLLLIFHQELALWEN